MNFKSQLETTTPRPLLPPPKRMYNDGDGKTRKKRTYTFH